MAVKVLSSPGHNRLEGKLKATRLVFIIQRHFVCHQTSQFTLNKPSKKLATYQERKKIKKLCYYLIHFLQMICFPKEVQKLRFININAYGRITLLVVQCVYNPVRSTMALMKIVSSRIYEFLESNLESVQKSGQPLAMFMSLTGL